MFETPFGRFSYLNCPFGINVAPEVFQSRIHIAIFGLQGVFRIADDILITGSGDSLAAAERDHDANKIALPDRCRQKGLKLNRAKLMLQRKAVTFMGFELTADGLRPSAQKIEATERYQVPQDKPALQRFATFVAICCPNFSDTSAVLRELLKEENEFHLDVRHHNSYEKLKKMLTTAPVLQCFSPSRKLVIECDASQSGYFTRRENCEICLESHDRTEKMYDKIEKELLAVVHSFDKWDTYMCESYVMVETDHKPLGAMNKKALAASPKHLQPMILRLQRYDFELVYQQGGQTILADTLSRAFPPTAKDTKFPDEVAALSTMDTEQAADVQMIVSADTLAFCESADRDNE